ncbi:WD repeat-containing protein 76-like [Mustelus asterias]
MKPMGNRRSLRPVPASGRPQPGGQSRKRPSGRKAPAPASSSRRLKRRMTGPGTEQRGDIPPVPTTPIEADSLSSNQSDSASSGDEELPLAQSEQLSAYEKKRLKNVQENAQFFASLSMLETAQRLRELGKRRPIKRQIAPRREKVKSSGEQPIIRRSMRLLRLDPKGIPLPEIPIETQEEPEERISGPVKMIGNEEGNEITENLMNTWLEISQGEMRIKGKQPVELKKYKSSLNKMTVQEGFVAKVTTNRICSLAFHPSQHKFLVAAGSTYGHVGLWDLSSEADAIHQFRLHIGAVNCLHFSPSNSAELLSLSNDGTVRCGNVAAAVFDEVYTSNTWNCSAFDFLSEDGSTLIVSHWDGDVAVVDRRTPSTSAESDAYLGINHLRTVSVHPVHRQYFVTAGDQSATIFDIRNLKKSHNKAVAHMNGHTKKVNSAVFSPITGNRVVTISMDDRIRIFDTSAIIPKIPVVASIAHNNYTGRWLTKFRAVWDPKRDDCFVVGSMARPRQIEVFHDTGSKVHEFRDADWLGSVCSINVMHPTKNILVGGNSSGRLHVFTDSSLSGR